MISINGRTILYLSLNIPFFSETILHKTLGIFNHVALQATLISLVTSLFPQSWALRATCITAIWRLLGLLCQSEMSG